MLKDKIISIRQNKLRIPEIDKETCMFSTGNPDLILPTDTLAQNRADKIMKCKKWIFSLKMAIEANKRPSSFVFDTTDMQSLLRDYMY